MSVPDEGLAAGRRLFAELKPEIESRSRAFASMMMLEADVGVMDQDESAMFDVGVIAGMCSTIEVLRDHGWITVPAGEMP